jgi:hypothetical protein
VVVKVEQAAELVDTSLRKGVPMAVHVQAHIDVADANQLTISIFSNGVAPIAEDSRMGWPYNPLTHANAPHNPLTHAIAPQ